MPETGKITHALFISTFAFLITVSYAGLVPAYESKPGPDPKLVQKLTENLCLNSSSSTSPQKLEATAGCTDCATSSTAGAATSTNKDGNAFKQVADVAAESVSIKRDLEYFRFATAFYNDTSVEAVRHEIESVQKRIATINSELKQLAPKSKDSAQFSDLKVEKAQWIERSSKLEAKLKDRITKQAEREKAWARQTDEENLKELQEYQKKNSADNAVSNPGFQECSLSKAELHALYFYTDHGYVALNSALREGGSKRARFKVIEDMVNSALSKLPTFDGMARRGADLPANVLAQHQVGAILTYDAFTSTSIGHGFDAKHRFIIKSKTGRYVAPFSAGYSEQEVLFKSGTKFKILSREEKNGGIEFVMEEISDSEAK